MDFQALRDRAKREYVTALEHIDWLENYLDRPDASARRAEQAPAEEDEPDEPTRNGHYPPLAQMVDEAVFTLKKGISTVSILEFIEDRFGPSARASVRSKYVGTRLSRLARKGELSYDKHSTAGRPAVYHYAG